MSKSMPRWRLGIAAAGAILAMTTIGSVSAFAASAPADASADNVPYTTTLPGSDTSCTSDFSWRVVTGFGGSSEVEWTSNPCGFAIQERSWCADPSGGGSWQTSGVVKQVGLEDKSTCSSGTEITRGEVRFESGSTWSAWQTFWHV